MEAPKRILIFSLTYFPFVGGAEVAVKEITDRVGVFDVEFDMITLRFGSDALPFERVGKINVYRIGFTKEDISISDTYSFPLFLNKYLFPFIAYFKARALHKDRRYSAVWSIMANYAGFAALFFKLSNGKTPFVLTLQEGDPISYIKRRVMIVYPLFKLIFKKADIVQTISHYLAGFARSMRYRGPIEVIPNGVDVKMFSRKIPKEKIESLRKRLKKKTKEKYVITISRLVKKNAVDDIIKSLEHLPDKVKLLIVGEGPDAEKLWNLANELGVAHRVLFLGHLPHEKLVLYLRISDVFARPSLSEGMGNVFIEAMASGIPVVATPVGGIPDFLADGSTKIGRALPTGLFCNVRDPKSIAEKVTEFLENKELRERTTKNAKALATEKYDWSRVAKDMREKVFGFV